MPHIIVEMSDDVEIGPDVESFLSGLNIKLAEFDTVEIAAVKSRLKRYAQYAVADLGLSGSFVHLQLSLLAGRSEELKAEMGRTLFEYVKESCATKGEVSDCKYSVEVRDMDASCYFK